jgi:hypothetical protein
VGAARHWSHYHRVAGTRARRALGLEELEAPVVFLSLVPRARPVPRVRPRGDREAARAAWATPGGRAR